jgi:L-ascorbate metabolism protein UlaG (beta-lactamase superfamily)
MIRVTFLAHSGFLVELPDAALLFDWWKGELPPLPAKPLWVFASHRHHDHFDPHIFGLDDGRREVRFLLGKDIRLDAHSREQWGLRPETAEKCVSVAGNQTVTLPGLTVETLPSTDEGVAFLVTCGGKTVYHAGDLNWWHWEGEDKGWNRNMEVDFKRYIEPLRGRTLELAFAPLDHRLGAAADWGFRYLLELAQVRHAFPMHQWEDFSPTARFQQAYPELAASVIPVEYPGQSWELAEASEA